ncbi:MAG TPA: helix-turn-helix domain-containing protein [Reyranella sp.]|nr:helix-turn-helix domain-containing protein [Reyranella sp.]
MEREASPGGAVGRLLRDQREARGLSMEEVAQRLRIRRIYLEAIERGRFDQLPGAAYIRAFLRAYASHLGLDAEKVVTAYQLSGPVPIERPVALPADFPLLEKRAPIGLAVLTLLLVVGAGYAVWHYMPRQEAVVAQKVPPVPDRLLATQSTPQAETSAAEQAPAPRDSRAVQSPPPAAAVPATHWPLPKQETVVAPVVPAIPTAPPPPVVAIPAPPPAVISVPQIGQAQAAQTVVETPRPSETQESVARGTGTEPGNSAAVAIPPVRVDTKVVARTNSWIELRSPAGDVLAQSYVRAGESYTVPAGISYRFIAAR